MHDVVTYFDPQPAPSEVPVRLASPFAPGPPHPLARQAAEALRLHLRSGDLASGLDLGALDMPGGGKMFGVLVVAAPDGRVGYLRGFSGMLGGQWQLDGFAPPLFDAVAREAFWPAGEAELRTLHVEHLRAERSRQLWRQLVSTYLIPNARGEERPLGELYAPKPPPGGAGDCAAPKLLGQAYRHRLRPLALAEFWWGAPPLTGERHAGEYYPACRAKCGEVLPYMLQGLSVDPAPLLDEAPDPAEGLRLVYEDPWLLVVDKPRGLLSVPGRHAPLRDSVLVRLRRRDPEASGPLVVHALDAETSGLLLVARDPESHAALQRQFARREAERRHVAWLDGHVAGDQGVVELPLRGKRALTEWRVTRRTEGRTRMVLVPYTTHTHQLRIHAADPLGLGAPIVGDRLYGGNDMGLMLHAEALSFSHPHTGERFELECPAPF